MDRRDHGARGAESLDTRAGHLPLDSDSFRGVDVEAAEIVDIETPALDIESWTATDSGGNSVAAEDFRGRVLVLDFWNTWCVICRAQQPAMARVAADYSGRPVSFLGANVFETGDASAYWQALAHPYGYLRDAEPLADLYGVPWQPAVVVLGPQGETLLNLVGGSGDREELIREAIDAGLAGV